MIVAPNPNVAHSGRVRDAEELPLARSGRHSMRNYSKFRSINPCRSYHIFKAERSLEVSFNKKPTIVGFKLLNI